MICPKCGRILPENARFCGACGMKIRDSAQQDERIGFSGSPEPKAEFSRLQNRKGYAVAKPRRSRKTLLIGVVVLVLMRVVASLIGLVFLPEEQDKNVYVCLTDNGYELISNLEKWEAIPLAPNQEEPILIQYDPSGKYLYYFVNQDYSTGTATLMCAEYGKLRAGSSRNDEYIARVADNVSIYGMLQASGEYLEFAQDGSCVLFLDAERALYSYDGEKTEQIDCNVGNFVRLDEEGRLLYLVTPSGAQSSTLYLADLKDMDKRSVLAEDINTILLYNNPGEILYTRQDPEDYSLDIYLLGINQPPVLLASDMPPSWEYVFSDGKGKTCYLARSEKSNLIAQDTGFSIYTLNNLQDGVPVCIQDDIWYYLVGEGVLICCVWDTDEPMDDVMALEELENAGKIKYFAYDMQSGRTSSFARGFLTEIQNKMGSIEKINCAGNKIFMTCVQYDDHERTFVAVPMDQGVISQYSILAEDGQYFCESGGEQYYLKNSFEKDGSTYADLYRYSENGSKCVLENVIASDIVVYEDCVILASTNRSSDYLSFDLVMRTEEGERLIVAENVKMSVRVDEDTLLYISGEDLYCFDGQERRLIAQDIHSINSSESVPFDTFQTLTF